MMRVLECGEEWRMTKREVIDALEGRELNQELQWRMKTLIPGWGARLL
jgi:hypothetical protein